MKYFLVLAALAAGVMAYEAVSSPPCNEYEVHKDCGSACHPTCETFEDDVNICTLQCVIGCYCKDGLYRTEVANSGACVPGDKCKQGQGDGRSESDYGDEGGDEDAGEDADEDTWSYY
ncbi:hypothetical protein AN5936.2 [Aspergillus nidulans FGSC A4]|uniref:TIL domain-containing protein n=1 Tax=Emericella nidulans (strain FGSC A4 / ATCC 38163 / CBS 112.46 / NRRL 194 / M139) TaxID=227321 RepID=Q5B0J4_EMENI|nr:hypothetical protein [Aspergillus nidulans FGSC A4]EAA57799.1 hypothetical protein AN5936.2 [Aspergillus nidulans FGSC A4]CBF70531.1 TPA: hypothetical protein ANIA_05936 [Aspergillus nidulans FGSC A4]|eukprot:XP_663540.1 hypothetical protein AN5936.2 [Aspergillus nidulans FGSC A4]